MIEKYKNISKLTDEELAIISIFELIRMNAKLSNLLLAITDNSESIIELHERAKIGTYKTTLDNLKKLKQIGIIEVNKKENESGRPVKVKLLEYGIIVKELLQKYNTRKKKEHDKWGY